MPLSNRLFVSRFLLYYLMARRVGTKAQVTRSCGGPHQAFDASRSDQLQR